MRGARPRGCKLKRRTLAGGCNRSASTPASNGATPLYLAGTDFAVVSGDGRTRRGGQLSYQHPINAPFIVREGDKSHATVEGVFTDYWERIR